jgi:hypothetical protein
MGGLYTKKQYEKHLEAIDAASSCISASIARSHYGIRLEPYQDDFIEISEMFWAKCPITKKKLEEPGPDVKEVATVFLFLVRGTKGLGGFQAQRYEAVLERCRRKLKGKLLGTRMILMDADKKPKCEDVENHKQICKCKALTLVRMAQAQENM